MDELKETVIGSREECENIYPFSNSAEQQKRYDIEWKRMYSFCQGISDICDSGVLNEGKLNPKDLESLKAMKGSLYYYNQVVLNNERVAIERIYLIPYSWGPVSFTSDGSDIWRVYHDFESEEEAELFYKRLSEERSFEAMKHSMLSSKP
ncbi:MAG: hypothetical protein KKH98_05315 [Spirochaetes bacterium]|nr:hypothetical protein [Spirochaetota bacterium]